MIELRPFDEPAKEASEQIVYKVAATQHEREAAFRLVYDAYRRLDIVPPNRFRMRVMPYHLLPTTDVLIATNHDRVLCTLTLVGDGELGLPMEDVYAAEIAQTRRHGIHIVEASSLAIRGSESRSALPAFLRLTQLACCCARHRGMQQIVIAVHPRHSGFYRRLMKFRLIGETRPYPRVRHQPAVALCLDFDRVRREHIETYTVLFGASLPAGQLLPKPMSKGEVAYFRPISKLLDGPTSDRDLGAARGRVDSQQLYKNAA
jgi:N-acyl-L-homoserine lactone synthetase